MFGLSAIVVLSRVAYELDVPLHDASNSLWQRRGPVPPDEHLYLTVQLVVEPAARDALEAAFWAVSEPESTRYGQHLNVPALKDLLAVPRSRMERVRDYFLTLGASEATPSPFDDVLTVRIKAADAERALQTSLGAYVHTLRPDVGHIIRASTRYSLPTNLARDVSMIGELHQFPRLGDRPRRRSEKRRAGVTDPPPGGDWPNACADISTCNGWITPQVLWQRYKLPINGSASKGDALSSMAVAEFAGQHYLPYDLSHFNTGCNVNVSVQHQIGSNTPPLPGVEAELDIEYIKVVREPRDKQPYVARHP